jgi:23S rRNA (cytosine1962-C5)-methyltransferase
VPDLWPDFDQRWVVHEDDDLLVVDKPAHVPAQAADESHDDDLVSRLKRWLGNKRGQPPESVYLGVHQRLDRDTSGLVLFTLRREANAAIAAQFEERSIDKTYLAVVQGLTNLRGERVLKNNLVRGRDGRMEVVAGRGQAGKAAVTRVRVLRHEGPRALLGLGCDTGRTHQLRVQLAHEAAPIAGDRLYGGPDAMRLLLHSARLCVRHPADGRALQLDSPAPLELDHYLVHGAVDAVSNIQLLRRALELALQERYRLGKARDAAVPTTAFRLLHGVAEGAAELAVDVYGDYLVAHFFCDAITAKEEAALDVLHALGFAGIYQKCHPRQKNELGDPQSQALAPSEPVRGQAAPEELVVHEHGVPFAVRLGDGLRTGLFLDQRDNRQRVKALASGKRVLNLFAYTGGFSVAALAGGAAEAVCVDASANALAWAQRNSARIGAGARHRIWHTDVFDALRRMARRGERFDLIILDPPSYATTRARRFVALRDYQGLAEACIALLAPEGQLLACINHHGASQRRLRWDLQQAALHANRGIAKLKDLPAQLDFPAASGQEPHNKSVLLTCS